MRYEDVKKYLYDNLPDPEAFKVANDRDKAWRMNVERSYMLLGNSKSEANRMAWDDYWTMVKEDRGFEVSFHKIGGDNNEL